MVGQPVVSIIVPTYNEDECIEKNIVSILSSGMDEDFFEVIYVDGGSVDKTKEIISKYSQEAKNIRLLENPKRYTPFALNIGILAAKGEYVICVGAHSSFSKDYIEILVGEMIKGNFVAAGGTINILPRNNTEKARAIAKVLSHPFGVGGADYRIKTENKEIRKVDTAGFLCYKRALLLEVGLYDERLFRNQDIELNKRIKHKGHEIYLVPTATMNYFARGNYIDLAKNNYANGKWNLLTTYYCKGFRSLSLRHYVPLLFTLSLLVPGILAIIYVPFIYISLISLVTYVVTLLLVSKKESQRLKQFVYLLWAFIVLHFSYGVGSLLGVIKVIGMLMIPNKRKEKNG